MAFEASAKRATPEFVYINLEICNQKIHLNVLSFMPVLITNNIMSVPEFFNSVFWFLMIFSI
jgi:hypothetical protein